MEDRKSDKFKHKLLNKIKNKKFWCNTFEMVHYANGVNKEICVNNFKWSELKSVDTVEEQRYAKKYINSVGQLDAGE